MYLYKQFKQLRISNLRYNIGEGVDKSRSKQHRKCFFVNICRYSWRLRYGLRVHYMYKCSTTTYRCGGLSIHFVKPFASLVSLDLSEQK